MCGEPYGHVPIEDLILRKFMRIVDPLRGKHGIIEIQNRNAIGQRALRAAGAGPEMNIGVGGRGKLHESGGTKENESQFHPPNSPTAPNGWTFPAMWSPHRHEAPGVPRIRPRRGADHGGKRPTCYATLKWLAIVRAPANRSDTTRCVLYRCPNHGPTS
jgi:hypothetical protein